MMHIVKDAVSKLLHPSFLFSASSDTDRSKRKRSTSTERTNDESLTNTVEKNGHTPMSPAKFHRPSIRHEESLLSDDDDDDAMDILSFEKDREQQNKRRRTANYSHIISGKTNTSNHEEERRCSLLTSTNSVGSVSTRRMNLPSTTTNTTTVLLETNDKHKNRSLINRLPSSFAMTSTTFRGSNPNYDPSKSPLFSVGIGKTATSLTNTPINPKSNEYSTNYLLASSLTSRPHPPAPRNQPSSATLTNPTINHQNRPLSIERRVFSSNYSPIQSRRLPYIERLRQRTLKDCIRLNRTTDNELISLSTVEVPKSSTVSPIPTQIKAPETECGIQCDIKFVENTSEPNKQRQQSPPPDDIHKETLFVPTRETTTSSSQTDSPIQTNSSITIEITKPKVLGDVTAFSWPKFARAQEEFAITHPDKCRVDTVPSQSVPPTASKNSPFFTAPILIQPTSTSTIPTLSPFSSVAPAASQQPVESIWKCSACTKENPAQAVSCPLCHGINPNYKRSTMKTTSKSSPDTLKKQSYLPKLVSSANQPLPVSLMPTPAKESVLSTSFGTTNPSSTILSLFGTLPSTSSINTQEKTGTNKTNSFLPANNAAIPLFRTSSLIIANQNTTSTTNIGLSPFGAAPIVSSSAITKETTNAPSPSNTFFRLNTSATLTALSTENPATTPAPFGFSMPPSIATGNILFQANTTSQGFGSLSATSAMESSIFTSKLNALPPFKFGSIPVVATAPIPLAMCPENPADTASVAPSSRASPLLFGASTTSNTAAVTNPFSISNTTTFPSPTPSLFSSVLGSNISIFSNPSALLATNTKAAPQPSTTISSSLPFGSPNAPPLFRFGATSNSPPNTNQSLTGAGISSAGFVYQPSTFAGFSGNSSGTSSNVFDFGTLTNTSYQASGTTTASVDQFSPDSATPFNVGVRNSSPSSTRRIATRRHHFNR